MTIKKDITIEELVDIFPPAVNLLSQYGIRCLICGEPSWGTLESASTEKGITEEKLNDILKEINFKFNEYKEKKI